MLEKWMLSKYAVQYHNITKVLALAACIPPSTAKVERTFSSVKLVCTWTRKRLSQENLGACMHICKYKELSECDFQEIMDLWLEAEDTAFKKR